MYKSLEYKVYNRLAIESLNYNHILFTNISMSKLNIILQGNSPMWSQGGLAHAMIHLFSGLLFWAGDWKRSLTTPRMAYYWVTADMP